MYKFSDSSHTTVTNTLTGATGIGPGSWMWDKYQLWLKGGEVTEPFDTRTQAEIDAANALALAIKKRKADIDVAVETQGLREVTILQADEWINSKLDAAMTVVAVKQAIREILLRMVPYILPKE